MLSRFHILIHPFMITLLISDITSMVKRDCTNVTDPNFAVIQQPTITTFPPQLPISSNVNDTELQRRNTTIRHLSYFSHAFADRHFKWLRDLGESCDPGVHTDFTMNTNNYTVFYETDVWHEQVCNFLRFLHCDPNSRTCVCAPPNIYGVKFQTVGKENPTYNPKVPCHADVGEPCYIYLKENTWPGQDFRLLVNFHCPVKIKDSASSSPTLPKGQGFYYTCAYYQDKNGPDNYISERCHKCTTIAQGIRRQRQRPIMVSILFVSTYLSLIISSFLIQFS